MGAENELFIRRLNRMSNNMLSSILFHLISFRLLMRWRIANASRTFSNIKSPLLAQLCESPKSANKGKFQSEINTFTKWVKDEALRIQKTRAITKEKQGEREMATRSWSKSSKWLHAIQLNFGFHFGTFFLFRRNAKTTLPRFASDMFAAACAFAHTIAFLLYTLLALSLFRHTHFKFNSFSIFASFVPGSFKENGKFIEFILTRNMFASVHSLPFTHTLTCMHVHIKMLRDAEQAAVPIRLTAKGAQTHELSFVAHSLCRGSEQKNWKLHLDRVRLTHANFAVSYIVL